MLVSLFSNPCILQQFRHYMRRVILIAHPNKKENGIMPTTTEDQYREDTNHLECPFCINPTRNVLALLQEIENLGAQGYPPGDPRVAFALLKDDIAIQQAEMFAQCKESVFTPPRDAPRGSIIIPSSHDIAF